MAPNSQCKIPKVNWCQPSLTPYLITDIGSIINMFMRLFSYPAFVCLLFLVLILEAFPNTSDVSGQVVGVSDGDTITVLSKAKKQIRVRLYGIDCPELHQAYGSKAKQYTSQLVFHTNVKVTVRGTDSYGRTLGIVTYDGGDLNQELVASGLAWAYVHYSTKYLPIEKAARSKKIGLWTDNNPMPPWDFRNRQAHPAANSAARSPSTQKSRANSAIVYVTPNGNKYHRMECKTISGQGKPISIEEAKKRGLIPCKVCNP